jgi:hypothetical protein
MHDTIINSGVIAGATSKLAPPLPNVVFRAGTVADAGA